MSELHESSLSCVQSCVSLLQDDNSIDTVITRLDSLIIAIEETPEFTPAWRNDALQILERAVHLLLGVMDAPPPAVGRPKIMIPVSTLELLLSLKFKGTDIAKFYGVSKDTIQRRLRDAGLSVRRAWRQANGMNP